MNSVLDKVLKYPFGIYEGLNDIFWVSGSLNHIIMNPFDIVTYTYYIYIFFSFLVT